MRIDEVSLVEMAGMPFTVCRDTDRVLVTWSTTTRVTSMTTTMMAELDARRAYDAAVEDELEELGARRDYDTILQEELEELAVRREYDGALEAELEELAARRAYDAVTAREEDIASAVNDFLDAVLVLAMRRVEVLERDVDRLLAENAELRNQVAYLLDELETRTERR